MTALPQCIQLKVVAELLEDSDTRVEAATQACVKIIEEVSGEDMEEYLR